MFTDEELAEIESRLETRTSEELKCLDPEIESAVHRIYKSIRGDNDEPLIVWCDGPFQLYAIPVLMHLLLNRLKQLGTSHLEHFDSACDELLDSLTNDQWHRAATNLLEQIDHEALLQVTRMPQLKSTEIARYPEFSWSLLGVPFGPEIDDRFRRVSLHIQKLIARERTAVWRQLGNLPRLHTANKRTLLSSLRHEYDLQINELLSVTASSYTGFVSPSSWQNRIGAAAAEQLIDTGFHQVADLIPLPEKPGFLLSNDGSLARFGQRLSYMLFGGLHTPLLGTWTDYAFLMILAAHREDRLATARADHAAQQMRADLGLLFASVFGFIPLSRAVFICRQPSMISFDAVGRLHGETGPCAEFADGTEAYALQGVTVSGKCINDRANLTAEYIQSTRNVERRRVLIELFGVTRYIQECDAEIVNQDEFGTLYRKRMARDEHLVMVRVKNSTPEPDGTFREYFLRVPPNMRTAREAIAWTFDMEADEYNPLKQT